MNGIAAKIQNAEIPRRYPAKFFKGLTEIKTGLDIGNYVHVDNAYEEYIRATDILAGNQVSTSRNFPYSDGPPPRHKNEGGGPTLSPPYA